MDLYLLRHAIAEERGKATVTTDAERPLTTEGRKKLREIAAGMAREGCLPAVILASPYVRARDTALLVAEVQGGGVEVVLSAALAPGAPPERLLAELNQKHAAARVILLVGHEPDLGELVASLITGRESAGIRIKKGGLAKLQVETPVTPGGATLEWLLTPRQLRARA